MKAGGVDTVVRTAGATASSLDGSTITGGPTELEEDDTELEAASERGAAGFTC